MPRPREESLAIIKEAMERDPRNTIKVLDALNEKKRQHGHDVVQGVEALRKMKKAGSRRRRTRRR
jgi:hypothetical protein